MCRINTDDIAKGSVVIINGEHWDVVTSQLVGTSYRVDTDSQSGSGQGIFCLPAGTVIEGYEPS
jgi:hypothetical protein